MKTLFKILLYVLFYGILVLPQIFFFDTTKVDNQFYSWCLQLIAFIANYLLADIIISFVNKTLDEPEN